jgi:threonine dehydrogenase-like Zn-dependent dehydrogenase
MKAAKYKSPGKIVIEDVAIPEINDTEVLIRSKIGGICGSDIHAAALGIFYDNVTIGHEFAGIIEKAGKKVRNLKTGDRVVVNPNKSMCNQCYWCKKGEYNLCKAILEESIGVCKDGGFAEYVKVRSSVVSKLPDNVTMEQGAFVEPLACSLRAVRISHFLIGETAFVIGAGPIGLLAIECLKRAGAKDILVSEIYDERLKLAKKVGADRVLNSRETDIVTYFKNNNVSPGYVFECSGALDAVDLALEVVRERGTITIVGICTEKVPFNTFTQILKEVAIKSSFAYVEEFDMAIELLGRNFFDVNSLITKVIPLDEINQGFEELKNPQNAIKILIEV